MAPRGNSTALASEDAGLSTVIAGWPVKREAAIKRLRRTEKDRLLAKR